MDIFESVLGAPVGMGVKLVIVTVILVAVLLLIFWIIRKVTSNGILKAPRGRQPRLAVTDAASMDEKRRLVLVRRDNVEHLVMIGGTTDVLIETNIIRNQPVRAPANQAQSLQPAAPVQTVPVQTAPQPEIPNISEPIATATDANVTPTKQGPTIKTAATIAAGALTAKIVANTSSFPEIEAKHEPIEPEQIVQPAQAITAPSVQPKITNEVETIIPTPETKPASEIKPVPAPLVTAPIIEPIPVHTPKDITSEIAGFAPDEKPVRPPTPIVEIPETPEEPELSQSAIANLEDALGSELNLEDETTFIEVTKTSDKSTDEPLAETDKPPAKKEPEDEMQKLLNELAGEKA